MSIKNINNNINSKFGISLHDKGRSLLSLVQDYGDFLTHYLNVTSIPIDTEYPGDGNNKRPLAEAYNTMKLTVALSAITGNIWKLKKGSNTAEKYGADVFVVNGNDGKFKVYFMDDILNILSTKLELIKVDGIPDHYK